MRLRQTNRRRGLIRAVLALLAICLAGVLAMAPWNDLRYGFTRVPPPPPSGPFATQIIDIPAAEGLSAIRLFAPKTAAAAQAAPLILYMPGFQGRATDNDALLANLASHGYAIAAFDDIAHDAPPAGESESRRAARRGDLDYRTEQAYRATSKRLDVRAEMSAHKMTAMLDRLERLARLEVSPLAAVRLDFSRVGALGFSFGGATAIEAMARDSRILAAANLDGDLAGRTATEIVDGPYLELNSTDRPVVWPKWMAWLRPTNAFVVEEARLARKASRDQTARPNAHLIVITGARHNDFTDALHGGARWRGWRPWLPPLAQAERVRSITDAYLLAFFGAHLRGEPSPLLTASPSPFEEVRFSR
ncbi:MAG: hypothetical protein MRY74_08575 [Neomegalonema sp.]|nr:hypothetical protein [Neomegalonema sp.]